MTAQKQSTTIIAAATTKNILINKNDHGGAGSSSLGCAYKGTVYWERRGKRQELHCAGYVEAFKPEAMFNALNKAYKQSKASQAA